MLGSLIVDSDVRDRSIPSRSANPTGTEMSSTQRKQEKIVKEAGTVPPVYWIDLDLPPYQRYVELAKAYADQVTALTGLFDELVVSLHPKASPKWFKRLARILLTKLYTQEETEEIRGISDAAKVDFFLVVALNVLLDLLMGCTSGVVRCREKNEAESKMLHFRTLDWGMEELRKVIVQLNFKHSKSTRPDHAVATSINYVGCVGILTGVRKGLSISLNFRPLHNATTFLGHVHYYSHLLFVLLGWRRSISSLLRSLLLSSDSTTQSETINAIANVLPNDASTAAYLVFSDGNTALTMEKDHRTACLNTSTDFMVLTNHDLDEWKGRENHRIFFDPITNERITLAEAIQESVDRRQTMMKNWQRKVKQLEKAKVPDSQDGAADVRLRETRRTTSRASQRSQKDVRRHSNSVSTESQETHPPSETAAIATKAEVVKWLSKYPTSNEQTHFAAILDAREGKVAWVRQYLQPIPEPV